MKLEKEDILLYGLNYYNDECILDSSGIILQSELSEDELKILDCLKGNKVKVTIEGIMPILSPKEKEYLSNVIRPFRNSIICVRKIINEFYNDEDYIVIYTYNGTLKFPPFKKGSMYQGMELNKEYTLEDLNL